MGRNPITWCTFQFRARSLSLTPSVPSNNSSMPAASLVNHAVFAGDLAKIVAGLYICSARLQERPATIQCVLAFSSPVPQLHQCSDSFPLLPPLLPEYVSLICLFLYSPHLSSLTGKKILTLPQQRVSAHTESLLLSNSEMRQMQAYQRSY